jgi:hypothetical protein
MLRRLEKRRNPRDWALRGGRREVQFPWTRAFEGASIHHAARIHRTAARARVEGAEESRALAADP